MQEAVVTEKARENVSPYTGDLPACIATGHAAPEAEQQIHATKSFHMDGLNGNSIELPERSCVAGRLKLVA